MIFINLRKYRIIVVAVIILVFVGASFSSVNWVLKILYPMHYRKVIEKYSEEYNMDPYLVAAVIRTESKFNEKAISNKDARGLMQISPVTGEWASDQLKIKDYNKELLFVPEVNIMIGCWYLDMLKKEFGGRLQLILAAYNGGSGNVNKWLSDAEYSKDGITLNKIPFNETKNYVEKVSKAYKIYRILYR